MNRVVEHERDGDTHVLRRDDRNREESMKRLLEQAQDEHRQDHESGEPVVSDAPLAEERSYRRDNR